MARSIRIIKEGPLFCELVNRGRFIKTAAKTPGIPLPHVIDEKEDDVWPALSLSKGFPGFHRLRGSCGGDEREYRKR